MRRSEEEEDEEDEEEEEEEEEGCDSDDSSWDDEIIGAARRVPKMVAQALSPTRDGPRFVGRRITVWWGGDGDDVWYAGEVARYNEVKGRRGEGARHKFRVHYDDGDKKEHYLHEGEVWRLL